MRITYPIFFLYDLHVSIYSYSLYEIPRGTGFHPTRLRRFYKFLNHCSEVSEKVIQPKYGKTVESSGEAAIDKILLLQDFMEHQR